MILFKIKYFQPVLMEIIKHYFRILTSVSIVNVIYSKKFYKIYICTFFFYVVIFCSIHDNKRINNRKKLI